MAMDEEQYRAYVENVNKLTLAPDDFGPFLHEELIVNRRSVTRGQFTEGLAKHLNPYPGAVIHIELLVAERDYIDTQVMVRNGDKDGVEVEGQLFIHKHCFYRTSDGLIEERSGTDDDQVSRVIISPWTCH